MVVIAILAWLLVCCLPGEISDTRQCKDVAKDSFAVNGIYICMLNDQSCHDQIIAVMSCQQILIELIAYVSISSVSMYN